MMRLFIFAILISAGAADCQGGQCALDDETSLMQKTAKLHDPEKVKKLQQDWAAFKSDMDDALSVEQDQVLKNNTVGRLGGDDGFYGSGHDSTCFLSKRTVFTLPGITLNKGCDAAEPMHKKEVFLDGDMACKACQQKLQNLPVKQAIKENYFTGSQNYGDQSVYLIKHIEMLFMEDDGTQLPRSCQDCDSLSRDVCIARIPHGVDEGKARTQQFVDQQAYMLKLAQGLEKFGVNLYLDFQDKAADKLVKDYGGRDVAFKTPLVNALMMTLLAVRAYESQSFVHWEGAAGSYCMAESRGGDYNHEHHGTSQNLRSAPVAYLKDKSGEPSEFCGIEHDLSASGDPFAERLCQLCGGHHCGQICP